MQELDDRIDVEEIIERNNNRVVIIVRGVRWCWIFLELEAKFL